MRILYLDSEWRVHVENGNGRTPWADAFGFFDGKCDAYIEGYRIVPFGHRWARNDGAMFIGEMITPAVSVRVIQQAQLDYERSVGV